MESRKWIRFFQKIKIKQQEKLNQYRDGGQKGHFHRITEMKGSEQFRTFGNFTLIFIIHCFLHFHSLQYSIQ